MPHGAVVSLALFSPEGWIGDVILKNPKPIVAKDFCQACGGTGKAVRPHPKNSIRLSLPDCPRCNGAGRIRPN